MAKLKLGPIADEKPVRLTADHDQHGYTNPR